VQRRFPWGDAMDRRRVNLWASGQHTTVSVRALPDWRERPAASSSSSGNVWEWTSSNLAAGAAAAKIESGDANEEHPRRALSTPISIRRRIASSKAVKARWPASTTSARCALGFCDVIDPTGARATNNLDRQHDTARQEESLV